MVRIPQIHLRIATYSYIYILYICLLLTCIQNNDKFLINHCNKKIKSKANQALKKTFQKLFQDALNSSKQTQNALTLKSIINKF